MSELLKAGSSGGQETNDRTATVANLPEEEQQHGTMPMTQFAERTGEVLLFRNNQIVTTWDVVM